MGFWRQTICFLQLVSGVIATNLPYNPTFIFYSTSNDANRVYVLDPSTATTTQGQLAYFDVGSTTIGAMSKPDFVISKTLPFLASNEDAPLIASLENNDTITVYSGSCNKGATGSSMWVLNLREESATWIEQKVDTSSVSGNGGLTGANYLSAAISFSANASTETMNTYIFGGMCPSKGSTAQNWQSAADYSNQVLVLEPQADNDYNFAISPARGPPIPEAGFTVTALQATYSNATDGSISRQQNFLLLGGHTENAFINMSQVALFSLPQGSWSFLPIDPPQGDTDLLRRSDLTVEPRSGHTATLSLDGSKIVLYGGWVGDVNTPAEPQLAVLEIGAEYGGSGDWSWTVPSIGNGPVADDAGVYGHGAVLLPGNVVMFYGGLNILSASSRRTKLLSQSQVPANSFFNISSNSWLASYDTSFVSQAQQSSEHGTGPLSTSSQKAGLGAGLAFGLIALVVAVAIGLWYHNRLRQKREAENEDMREKEIENLSQTAQRWPNGSYLPNEVYGSGLGMADISDGKIRSFDHTGVDYSIPGSYRIPRRPVNQRGHYQITPRYDQNRLSRGGGTMHAIEEVSEEGSSPASSRKVSASRSLRLAPGAKDQNINPFRDPDSRAIDNNEPTTPAEERKREMSEWVQGWTAADDAYHEKFGLRLEPRSGRASPEKSDDRTSSNLSEGSMVSEGSNLAGAGREGSSSRSQRLLPKLLSSMVGPGYGSSSASDSTSKSRPSTAGGQYSDSFVTAKSSGSSGQPESEALLSDSPTSREHVDGREDVGTLRQQGQLATRLRGRGLVNGWVGSVRRALPRVVASSVAPSPSRTARPGVIGANGYYEYPSSSEAAVSASGKRDKPPTSVKRRATGGGEDLLNMFQDDSAYGRAAAAVKRSVSDGAAGFWDTKRGARDWDVEPQSVSGPTQRLAQSTQVDYLAEGPRVRHKSQQSERRQEQTLERQRSEDEWDVEAAAEERVVQVMFTMPREKLRIVNADVRPEEEGEDEVTSYMRTREDFGGTHRE